MKKILTGLFLLVTVVGLCAWNSGWLQSIIANDITITGHMLTAQTTAPTIGACGSGASVATGSSDFAGSVTVGSDSTTLCRVVFNTLYNNATVNCVATDKTSKIALAVTADTAAVYMRSTASMANDGLTYICAGNL